MNKEIKGEDFRKMQLTELDMLNLIKFVESIISTMFYLVEVYLGR